jgi:hypothetical protein
MIKDDIILSFKSEFRFLQDKFEIINLLENWSEMGYETIGGLKLLSDEYNMVGIPVCMFSEEAIGFTELE